MRAPNENAIPSRPLITRIVVRSSAYRHPRAWVGVCLAAGVWLVVLGATACGGGFWWGALLIAVAALLFWVGYHLVTTAHS